jgi:uncharacterized protein YggE
MREKKAIFVILALIAVIGLSAFTFPAGGGGGTANSNPRTISVTGSGKVYITPDIATINIGVHTEDADVAKALSDNTAKLQSVSDTLKSKGVAAADIQTTNFSVYPSQQYGPNGELTELKYAVDNTVTITVRDLTKFGEILSQVVSNGANNIYGITFDASDRSKALSEARIAAIKDAKAQADELAASAGVVVGKVITMSVNASQPTPMYAMDSAKMAVGSGAPAPISSGQLVISVDAYITYEMQ